MGDRFGKRAAGKNAILLVLVTIVQLSFLRIDAFQSSRQSLTLSQKGTTPRSRPSSTLNVLAEPPRGVSGGSRSSGKYSQKKKNARHPGVKKRRRKVSKEEVRSSSRWVAATEIEKEVLQALEELEEVVKFRRQNEASSRIFNDLAFPCIRDCNAALAAFGDGEDLSRALKLYFKMRKAAMIAQRYYPTCIHLVPKPTLVTFSTLMSRAVQLGKPLIAIRLWNTMRRGIDFFSAASSVPESQRIVPDARAANILMNCYAKLGYIQSAQDLLSQMVTGEGVDVPLTRPNLVTFNTLLDACHKAGDLDSALGVKEQLDQTGLRPDARTYTTLIATVARKASNASGANDPSLAFAFLQEMQDLDIRPNGMTYSALIDACGRCRRSDLALKGLRIMTDQKTHEQKLLDLPPYKRHTLPAEVGAWTAAINACGKAGRLETAVKLFYSMPNFGVYPNTITCGCLTDSLLRNGKTAESLDVLRYMKKYRIAPSEVMYTSLMTSASRLAVFENSKHRHGVDPGIQEAGSFPADKSGATSAVEIYTELMKSLIQLPSTDKGRGIDSPVLLKKGDNSNDLYRVSLVFQEMKAVGVEPDLACYNAVLKSCANAGDVTRASEILELIRNSDDLFPNEKTWRQMIRAASKANRLDIALSSWKTAVSDMRELKDLPSYRLSATSVVALLEALIRGSADSKLDVHTRTRLYQLIGKIFESIISGSEYLGMNLVDRQSVLGNPRAMVIFLQALVTLDKKAADFASASVNPKKFRMLAVSIVDSECFRDGLPLKLRTHTPYLTSYQTAKVWVDEESGHHRVVS